MKNYLKANPDTYEDVTPPLTPIQIEAICGDMGKGRFRAGLVIVVCLAGAVALLSVSQTWAAIAAYILLATVFVGLVSLHDSRDEFDTFKQNETRSLDAADAEKLKDFASTDSALELLLRTWYAEGRPVNERAFKQLHRIASVRRSLQERDAANAALADHFTMGARQ